MGAGKDQRTWGSSYAAWGSSHGTCGPIAELGQALFAFMGQWADGAGGGQAETSERSASLGSVAEGRLEFAHGVMTLALDVDAAMADLFRARFEGPPPDVEVRAGTVRVQMFKGLHPFDWKRRSVALTLNGSIPWTIDIKGGMAKMRADLGGLQVKSFSVTGGAKDIEITLPAPRGVVPVRITGGASTMSLHRPKGTAARLSVRGGAARLVFDENSFGSLGGKLKFVTPGAEATPDRYEIDSAGGASNMTVDTV